MTACIIVVALALSSSPPASKESRFQPGGFQTDPECYAFLASVQRAARKNDKTAIVKMVKFPFVCYENGKLIKRYRNRAALVKDFGRVFSPAVLKAIRKQRPETLFVNCQGVMIGDGQVWFEKWNGPPTIKAVNP